jgi:hypothetical protein
MFFPEKNRVKFKKNRVKIKLIGVKYEGRLRQKMTF